MNASELLLILFAVWLLFASLKYLSSAPKHPMLKTDGAEFSEFCFGVLEKGNEPIREDFKVVVASGHALIEGTDWKATFEIESMEKPESVIYENRGKAVLINLESDSDKLYLFFTQKQSEAFLRLWSPKAEQA
jgi:hypothetical protein